MTVERDDFIHTMRSVANSAVLVCLRIESRVAQAVTRNGTIYVNVLKHFASTRADRFAGRGFDAGIARFKGVDVVVHANGLPRAYVDGGYACVTRLPAIVPPEDLPCPSFELTCSRVAAASKSACSSEN